MVHLSPYTFASSVCAARHVLPVNRSFQFLCFASVSLHVMPLPSDHIKVQYNDVHVIIGIALLHVLTYRVHVQVAIWPCAVMLS